MKWIPKEAKEEHDAYYAKVQKLANEKNKPIAVRKGGGADLGLRGEAPDPKDREQYILLGAPGHRGPEIIQQFVERRGLEEVRVFSAPRTKRQGWLFMAKAGVSENILLVGADVIRVRPYKRSGQRQFD